MTVTDPTINPQPNNDPQLLVQTARMYYEQQLTQAEIGRRLDTSRSTVSRLLQEARDTGVVQITINYPWERDRQLEEQLGSLFELQTVRVLRGMSRSSAEVMEGMGVLAADYLNGIITDNLILGVSYGRSIASTIKHIQPQKGNINLTVVQIIGALGSKNPLIEGPDLVREMANAHGGVYRYLYAPLIVEDYRTRDLLLQEPYIQETLSLGKRADVIVIGIGALTSSTSGLIWTGYLTEKEQRWLSNIGSVGHMCAQFFDARGDVLDIELNKRTISIGLKALHSVKNVVTIAGTKEKAQAILGALRGQYIDTLITDDQAAREIVRLFQQNVTPPEQGVLTD